MAGREIACFSGSAQCPNNSDLHIVTPLCNNPIYLSTRDVAFPDIDPASYGFMKAVSLHQSSGSAGALAECAWSTSPPNTAERIGIRSRLQLEIFSEPGTASACLKRWLLLLLNGAFSQLPYCSFLHERMYPRLLCKLYPELPLSHPKLDDPCKTCKNYDDNNDDEGPKMSTELQKPVPEPYYSHQKQDNKDDDDNNDDGNGDDDDDDDDDEGPKKTTEPVKPYDINLPSDPTGKSEGKPGKTKEKKLWVLLFKMLFVYLLCSFVFKLALMWAPANSNAVVLLYCEIVRVTVIAADIVILLCFSDSLTSSFLYSLFIILGCYLIDVLIALI